MRSLATYLEIQRWVEEEFGFTPETCWIAHCKELYGLPVDRATIDETSNALNRARLRKELPSKRLSSILECSSKIVER